MFREDNADLGRASLRSRMPPTEGTAPSLPDLVAEPDGMDLSLESLNIGARVPSMTDLEVARSLSLGIRVCLAQAQTAGQFRTVHQAEAKELSSVGGVSTLLEDIHEIIIS